MFAWHFDGTIRMAETVRGEGVKQNEIEGVQVDTDLLQRLRLGLDATLTRQRSLCAAIGFDVAMDSFRAVMLAEGQERDDDR
jgi:hypothetical protein